MWLIDVSNMEEETYAPLNMVSGYFWLQPALRFALLARQTCNWPGCPASVYY
jgi:hypothetical protein